MKMLRLNSKKSLSHGLNELNKQADSKIKSSGKKIDGQQTIGLAHR